MMNLDLKFLLGGAAIAATLALTAPATADELVMVLPAQYGGDVKALEAAAWRIFADRIGPGDSFSIWDGTANKRIAKITVPDDSRFKSLKRKKRKFVSELRRFAAHFGSMAGTGSVGAGQLDILSVLRSAGENRLDASTGMHVMLVGAPMQITDDANWSMVSPKGLLQVPTDAALVAGELRTPYNVSFAQDALSGIHVHICGVDGPKRTRLQNVALRHVWGHWVRARGGQLVTWADDLAVCAERFGAKVTGSIKLSGLNKSLPPAMIQPVWNVAAKGDEESEERVEPSVFNVFFHRKHPRMKGLFVSTGVAFKPADYPSRYIEAWCYFNSAAGRDGVQVRVPVADKSFGEKPVNRSATDKQLKAAGVSRADFEAARSVCQFPSDEG